MSELDDSGRPLTEEGITEWWRVWGLSTDVARKQRADAYAQQKREAKDEWEMRTVCSHGLMKRYCSTCYDVS